MLPQWRLTACKTFLAFTFTLFLVFHYFNSDFSLQTMEGERSQIFERRATVSLKEKVAALEATFLGMRQSIAEDIKKDLRGELREFFNYNV